MTRGYVIAMLCGLYCSPLVTWGQTYFQQQVDYTIEVRLDDSGHMLHGSERFVYTNNSMTTLDTLWIHLWPNAYREKHTALSDQLADGGDLDMHFAAEEERGWIDSLDFTIWDAKRLTKDLEVVDLRPLQWGYHTEHVDIGWIKLNEGLMPGASVTISTPFRVKIPSGKFSRLGHTGQAYYITQWYPKPAVFDAQGWHAMPYLGNGEFYSEYGSFDVTITLPDNYVVGATGVLQNESERAWMDSLAVLPNADARRFKAEFQRKALNTFPGSSPQTKTIRFTQDRVHDFAWFADKRFIVRKSEVALPVSGRTVTTWALFTPKNAELWSDAVSYVNESVKVYSERLGDYPYDACTAVDGTISAGGGMEYPMITIIGDMGDKMGLDNVIAHEVGHNWFYGILGSNERDHAWMDEGMNSFVELLYMRKRYPSSGFNIGLPGLKKLTRGTTDAHRLQSELGYRLNARRNLDQPLSLTSSAFTEINYGTMVYMKTALIMDHLLAYLGEETMDRCLHAYFEEWKFKHPQPEDMRVVFERESGQKLDWLFVHLLTTDLKLDIKARKLQRRETDQRSRVTVVTRCNSPFPVPVTGYSGLDSLGTEWIMAEPRWMNPTWELLSMDPDRVVIDANNRTLDIDRRNNEVRSYGLFKRYKAPRFEWLVGLERNDRRSIYYALLPAFNGNDGFQLGAALRNTTFPSQRTEWVVAPLYGFASERWGGAGRIEHHFDRMRSRMFQNIDVGVSARSASEFRDHDAIAWYDKVSPYINFDLKRDPLTRPWQHRLGLRGVYLNNASRVSTPDDRSITTNVETFYTELTYRAEDKRKLHRSLIAPTITQQADFLRASLELRQAFAVDGHGHELRLRAFVGSFLWKRDDRLNNGLAAWGLSWGTEDLLYDHAYLERNARDAFFARQYNTQQGAFKTPFLQGGSDTWIGAINAEFDLPVPLPIALFASAGMVPITTVTPEGRSTGTATYFEGGIGIVAIRDVLELWVPLVVSKRIADEEKFLDRTVTDRIRFIFALQKLDPTRALRNLKP